MPTRARPFLPRLILPFAAMVVLIVAVCGATILWVAERGARTQQIDSLHRRLELIAQNWGAGEAASLDAARRGQLEDAARVLGARVTVLDGVGNVVFDSHHEPGTMVNHNDRPEVAAARHSGRGSDVRRSDTIAMPSVYVARLLDRNNPHGPVVRVSDTRQEWATLDAAARPMLIGAVAAAVLSCLVLWRVLQRQWIAPTRRLADAADRMAAGDWAQRVEPGGAADELRDFTHQMNLVAAHAQKQLADLRHQRADLQSLVDTLPDPILLCDPQGCVAMLNTSAARLLGVARPRALAQRLVNVVGDEAVLQLFERTRELPMPPGDVQPAGNGEAPAGAAAASPPAWATDSSAGASAVAAAERAVTRELRLHRDGELLTFHAVGTRTADGGVLMVLRDMTIFASAVQMKTDFVANASHELRTPIAAIKIAFETLRDVVGDDLQQTDRCVQVIDGHLRRLEEMLRDLLDLSRVESANHKPQVGRIRTSEVFAHVRGALSAMARQRGVELHLGECPAGGPADGLPKADELLADERLLNLVLKNLVENSIKFTPAGGSVSLCVRTGVPAGLPPAVGADESAGFDPAAALAFDRQPHPRGGRGGAGQPPVCVSVIDTGVGIPPEHLDRVFERFYQVDPSRSGSAGRGTGLGLAIVKHAVAAMGGTVHIESTVGKGTTVSLVLPQHADDAAGAMAAEDLGGGTVGPLGL